LTLVQEIRRDCRDARQRDSDAECDFRRQLCTAAAGTVGFVREEILRSGIAVGEHALTGSASRRVAQLLARSGHLAKCPTAASARAGHCWHPRINS
jgi:hypothetical protein